MKTAEGLDVLELSAEGREASGVLHAILVWDNGSEVFIDNPNQ